MNYKILGRTKLRVSEIGFGCGNVGGLMIRGSRQEQLEAVKLAVKLGINYFDTAPSYGDGKSEINLGQVLAELDPEIVLATKVRLSTDEVGDVSKAIRKSVELSLSRLQRDCVDVLQLHTGVALTRNNAEWPGTLSVHDVLGEHGVADVFDALRDQGLTKYIGFTGLGETAALHRVVTSKRFDVIQVYFNLLNPSSGYKVPQNFSGYNFEQLIDKAADNSMGTIAIRVMAAGAVGGEEARKGHAAPVIRSPMVPGGKYREDEVRARSFAFLVQGAIQSLPQAALKFALMHPKISTALVGFSNCNQIKAAVQTTTLPSFPLSHLNRLKKIWSHNALPI